MMNTFKPKKSLVERYSLESMAKQRGLSIDEFKIEIDKELKIRQDMVDMQIKKD